MKRILMLFAFLLSMVDSASAQQYRDVVELKNGSIIKGVIVEQVPNVSYRIVTADGSQFVCDWEDVLVVKKEQVSYNYNGGSRMKYQAEVFTGFGFGVGDAAIDRLYVHTVQGVRVNDYFSAGLGVGLSMIMPYTFDYNLPELYMPIYLNAKGYLPVGSKVNMYLSVDVGYSVGVTAGVTGFNGLMFHPSVGANIKTNNGRGINIGLGYDFQKISTVVKGLSMNMNALALRVGYQF